MNSHFTDLTDQGKNTKNRTKLARKLPKMEPENLPKPSRLPRGIHIVKWKNSSGETSIRYRVRTQVNGVKENRLFTTFEEAKEFLLLFKSKLGREKIYSLTEEERKQSELYKDILTNPTLGMLIDKYVEDYFPISPTEEHNTRRYKGSIRSFYKTIKQTKIPAPTPLGEVYIFEKYLQAPEKQIANIKPEEFTLKCIDDYIRARRKKGIKGISIERELTHFSNFFKALKRTQQYKSISNFAVEFDRTLLNSYKKEDNKAKQRKKAMTPEELENYLSLLDKAENPDLKLIVVLSLATAMRRSEIVDLKWEQVDFEDNIIYLPTTKGGYAREVVLTNEAKEILLHKKEHSPNQTGKVFSYKTYSGFAASYRNICERFDINVNFHRLRAEAFTRFFNALGSNGSDTMLAKFLGIRNVSKFIQSHKPKTYSLDTEQDIIKSGGHKSTQITYNNYLLNMIGKR